MSNKSIKLAIIKLFFRQFCLSFVSYLSIFPHFFINFLSKSRWIRVPRIYDLTKKIYYFFLPNFFRPFDGPGGGGGQSSPVPQTSGNKSVTRYEEISNKTRPGLNSYNNEWVVWLVLKNFRFFWLFVSFQMAKNYDLTGHSAELKSEKKIAI